MMVKDRPIRILIAHQGCEGTQEERHRFLTQRFNDIPDILERHNATLIMRSHSPLSFGARAAVPTDQYDALADALKSQNYLVQRTPEV